MLEVEQFHPGSSSLFMNPPHHQLSLSRRDKMPVDYASYLLSASPPGFDLDLHYSLRDHFGEDGEEGGLRKLHHGRGPPRSIMLNKLLAEENASSLADDMATMELVDKCTCPEAAANPRVSSSKCCDANHKMGRKKVSFADDVGLSLVSVRILTETTDTPPKLRPEILSSLAQGASAAVIETPPLVLNFTQPASEYLAFREKIERYSVSLENVILKDYNLLGTVKVKNIAFEKKVGIRCTFDGWQSQVEIPASFVPMGEQVSRSPYDTFSFEISVPPTMDVRNKVHFAVCYEAGGEQFWDNNNGANYEVVSADWKSIEQDQQQLQPFVGSDSGQKHSFTLGGEQADFSAWRHVDQETPYW